MARIENETKQNKTKNHFFCCCFFFSSFCNNKLTTKTLLHFILWPRIWMKREFVFFFSSRIAPRVEIWMCKGSTSSAHTHKDAMLDGLQCGYLFIGYRSLGHSESAKLVFHDCLRYHLLYRWLSLYMFIWYATWDIPICLYLFLYNTYFLVVAEWLCYTLLCCDRISSNTQSSLLFATLFVSIHHSWRSYGEENWWVAHRWWDTESCLCHYLSMHCCHEEDIYSYKYIILVYLASNRFEHRTLLNQCRSFSFKFADALLFGEEWIFMKS